MTKILWNDQLKLILADVDETIADVYTPATPAMIDKLTKLLKNNIILFFVTGAGFQSVHDRIIEKLPRILRKNILVAHCSGAEVCGFDANGDVMSPYLSTYDEKMNITQKILWRKIIDQLLNEFQLQTTQTMTVSEFRSSYGDQNPFVVMMADRGPQITLEFINAHDLTASQLALLQKNLNIEIPQYLGKFDLRTEIYNRAEELLVGAHLPVHPHLAGVFALDFILDGVSKTTAITNILTNTDVLEYYQLPKDIIKTPNFLEIWGDKFGINGGSDRKMCLAVDSQTRAIDFRKELRSDLGNDYNIQIWDGQMELHNGCLEYLSTML